MAPQKLTDQVLESILWNKVPVKLQLEVKELTDGSVQELLHKLLKAESVVEEWERRSSEVSRLGQRDQQKVSEASCDSTPRESCSRAQEVSCGKPSARAELTMQSLRCFKCSKMGHLAKACPAVETGPPPPSGCA